MVERRRRCRAVAETAEVGYKLSRVVLHVRLCRMQGGEGDVATGLNFEPRSGSEGWSPLPMSPPTSDSYRTRGD